MSVPASVAIAVAVVLALSAPVSPAGQVQSPSAPGRESQPARPPTVVLGRVIDGDSGEPIGGAIVRVTIGVAQAPPELVAMGLLPPGSDDDGPPVPRTEPQIVMSTGDGRFVLRDLPPGTYPITAQMPGYLIASHGQRRPQGPSESVRIAGDRSVVEVTMRMWKYAAIEGVVRDEAGEPAVGVQVRGLRSQWLGGQRRLVPGSTGTTDDRGVYRLASLIPGEYLVWVPSTTSSLPVATVDWFTEARSSGASSTELLQPFRESGAPTPSGTGIRVGEHQVQISGVRGSTTPDIGADGRLSTYRAIYHPSETSASRAAAITVASGEQRDNVDLQLVLQPAVEVSGQVMGPDGPAANLGVKLLPADADAFASETGLETSMTSTDPDGRFTLLGVPPGEYTLRVMRVPRPATTTTMTTITTGSGGMMVSTSIAQGAARPATPPGDTLWAEQALSVGDRSVAGVSMTLAKGVRVSGRFEFDGTSQPPAPDAMERSIVSLSPAGGRRLPIGFTAARPLPDGTFTTMGYPPGRYFLSAGASAPGWSVKAIEIGGRNVIDMPLTLGAEDIAGVVVRFGTLSSQLTGTVRLPAGSDGDALVVAFPADYRTWHASGVAPRRTRTTRVDDTGGFRIVGLPAGDYLIVAVPAGTVVDLQDPAAVAALARSATSLTLAEGGRQIVSLTLVEIR
jgi:hypothetical protein